MKITKHEHACLQVESAGNTLVIDPGSMTTALVGLKNVVAVVITHQHADHWTPEQLHRILEDNSAAVIFGPPGVAAEASGFDVTVVKDGDVIDVGPFTLRFFGEKHAVIHSSIPVVDNVGVLVNGQLYYAGDSFTIPEGVAVDTVAVPAGAPWMKIGEAMDYLLALKPHRSFPTHEMVLSVAGKGLSNQRLKEVTEVNGGEYFPLEPNESLDL
ncbi:MBL fold metallo-hydrolase [Parafrigoribacterium mesophilum]|uniref:MBL fold metallo-hydrolase n=1 Tax=Parafrigoribacterium mesophilum TaxID=433646 RepID=UPI0031FCFCB9